MPALSVSLWQEDWLCFQQRKPQFRVPREKHVSTLGSEVPGAHNLIDLQLVNFLLTLISNGSRQALLAWTLRGTVRCLAWPP